MKVIIIEDEAAAYNNIKRILNQLDPGIEILCNLDTVASSVSWLQNNPAPDLIFLDIQLADGSSFNIFECVNIDVPIIFTTAYDEYAINAFQVNSVDYLLKPITLESVRRALDKLNRVSNINLKKAINDIDMLLRPKGYTQRILVPVKDKILPVSTDKIAYFYNTEGVTELTTTDQKSYKIDKPLDKIILTLDPSIFTRANRQFIISKEVVRDITIWFDNRLLVNLSLNTPEKIFVSKNRAAEFKVWFAS